MLRILGICQYRVISLRRTRAGNGPFHFIPTHRHLRELEIHRGGRGLHFEKLIQRTLKNTTSSPAYHFGSENSLKKSKFLILTNKNMLFKYTIPSLDVSQLPLSVVHNILTVNLFAISYRSLRQTSQGFMERLTYQVFRCAIFCFW